MSEKPQEDRVEQEDLIGQIIAQGLDRMNAPVRTEDAPGSETPPAPKQEDAGEAALPADRKNRRSAVYFYLTILFGAAFLTLLLAYFIQQRNNAAVLDDLRSTTASREELLDEIRELESQVRFLQSVDDNWMSVYLSLEEEYAQSVEEGEQLAQDYYAAQIELTVWSIFWSLEYYYQAEDYESCAAILILQAQGNYINRIPDNINAQKRYEEIVKAVVRAGILDEDYLLHPNQYEDLVNAYWDRIDAMTEPPQ